MNILVVEDDPRVADFLHRGLRAEGYKVQVASDGQQGLAMVRSETFGVVLLDIMLPKMSGIEVCQHRSLRGRDGSLRGRRPAEDA